MSRKIDIVDIAQIALVFLFGSVAVYLMYCIHNISQNTNEILSRMPASINEEVIKEVGDAVRDNNKLSVRDVTGDDE